MLLGTFVVQNLQDFAGHFPGGSFSGHFFPQRRGEKNIWRQNPGKTFSFCQKRKVLTSGRGNPTNIKHLNVFLTPLAGQMSQRWTCAEGLLEPRKPLREKSVLQKASPKRRLGTNQLYASDSSEQPSCTLTLRGPAANLFISRDACSDRIAKFFHSCLYGVSHNHRAICSWGIA